MKIRRLKIINFKKFYGEIDVNFNEDLNIIIGDNEAGKSTILLALDLVLSGSKSKINTIGLENIFNSRIIKEFMEGNRAYNDLPIIYIELYLNETGNFDLNGNNNTEKINADGLYLKISPDEEYAKIINESLRNPKAVFPFEYYKYTFKTFADDTYNNYKKPIQHILIDSSTISNEHQIREYIASLYGSCTDEETRNLYNNEFRKIKKDFEKNTLKNLNNSLEDIKFGLSNNNKYSLENNLMLYESEVSLSNMGSGTQCMLKINNSIKKQSKNIDIILIEEPENHLSSLNMRKMINNIMNVNQKQMFITTHNSLICSRLNLNKVIALSRNNIKTLEFNKIDKETAKYFVKCPSNNLLDFILAEKVILVEGAAEYILMEKMYEIETKKTIHEDKINIISVNGLSFKRYLEIAESLKNKVAVITDNDKNYEENIKNKYHKYENENNIKIFSDNDENRYTFEVCIYEDNKNFLDDKISIKTKDKQKFMLNNKAEVAYKILNELEKSARGFNVPKYIKEAIKWIRE